MPALQLSERAGYRWMRSTIPLDVVVAMQQKAPAASEKGAKTGVVDLLKARYAEGGMNAIFSFGPPAAPSSFALYICTPVADAGAG